MNIYNVSRCSANQVSKHLLYPSFHHRRFNIAVNVYAVSISENVNLRFSSESLRAAIPNYIREIPLISCQMEIFLLQIWITTGGHDLRVKLLDRCAKQQYRIRIMQISSSIFIFNVTLRCSTWLYSDFIFDIFCYHCYVGVT